MRGNVLLVGYLGRGNFGDDGYLEVAKKFVRGEMAILGGKYPGFVSFPRSGLLKAVLSARAVIIPGGEIFQTYTSRRSFYYYLAVVRLAQLMGRSVLGCGMEVGELPPFEERLLRRTFRKFSLLTFRSSEDARKWGGEEGGDLLLSLDFPAGRGGGGVAVVLRRGTVFAPPSGVGGLTLLSLAKEDDEWVRTMGEKTGCRWEKYTGFWETVRRLAKFDVVVSERYHGLLIPGTMGIPVVGFGARRKVKRLCEEGGGVWDSELAVALERAVRGSVSSLSREYVRRKRALAERDLRAVIEFVRG